MGVFFFYLSFLSGCDPLVVQVNVLSESQMMIPDCRRRLESALDALRDAVVSAWSISLRVLVFAVICKCISSMGV